MRLKRFLLVAFLLVILAGAYFYGYPEALSYFPHTLHVSSSSLAVQGIYYVLPLAGVDSISLASGQLKVKGFYSPISRIFGPREIRRPVPKEMIVDYLIPDQSPIWQQSDMIIKYGGESEWKRTMVNKRTWDRFSFGDPFNSNFQIGHFYCGKGDTAVMAFAFGKMGQDAKTWMGCILITNRVGP